MRLSSRSLGSTVSARRRRAPEIALVALVAGLLTISIPLGCQSPAPQSLVEQGESALAEGRLERADALFQSALAESPDDPRALLGRARVLTATDDPEGALGLYRQMAKVAPPYFRSQARPHYAHTLLAAGELRLRRGQSRDALAALRVLQKMNPTYKGLSRALGQALAAEASRAQMEGRTADALTLYTETTHVAPQRVEYFIAATELLLAAGRNGEAKALLARAREHHSDNRQIRALTLAALGMY